VKTSTKLTIADTAMLLTAAAIFGGVQVVGEFNQLGVPVKLSVSLASTPTPFATEAPVVNDHILVFADCSHSVWAPGLAAIPCRCCCCTPGAPLNANRQETRHAFDPSALAQHRHDHRRVPPASRRQRYGDRCGSVEGDW
jgi:hypothetical protein